METKLFGFFSCIIFSWCMSIRDISSTKCYRQILFINQEMSFFPSVTVESQVQIVFCYHSSFWSLLEMLESGEFYCGNGTKTLHCKCWSTLPMIQTLIDNSLSFLLISGKDLLVDQLKMWGELCLDCDIRWRGDWTAYRYCTWGSYSWLYHGPQSVKVFVSYTFWAVSMCP